MMNFFSKIKGDKGQSKSQAVPKSRSNGLSAPSLGLQSKTLENQPVIGQSLVSQPGIGQPNSTIRHSPSQSSALSHASSLSGGGDDVRSSVSGVGGVNPPHPSQGPLHAGGRLDSFNNAEVGDLSSLSCTVEHNERCSTALPAGWSGSALSKNLTQVLSDRDALAYFIQFMDSAGASNLLKFWLDVETFRTLNEEKRGDATNQEVFPSANHTTLSELTIGGSPVHGNSSDSDRTVDQHSIAAAAAAAQHIPATAAEQQQQIAAAVACTTRDQMSESSEHGRLKTGGGASRVASCVTAHGDYILHSNQNTAQPHTTFNDVGAGRGGLGEEEEWDEFQGGPSVAGATGLTSGVSAPCTEAGGGIPWPCTEAAAGVARNSDLPGVVKPGFKSENNNSVAACLNASVVCDIASSEGVEDERWGGVSHPHPSPSGPSLSMPCNDVVTGTANHRSVKSRGEDRESSSDRTERSPRLNDLSSDILSSRSATLRSNIASEDAVLIFTKYLSPDCTHPITIDSRLRAETVRRICREDGRVDPHCFSDCQKVVYDIMDQSYFGEFVRSTYYIKHQVDILTSSQLTLTDFLYNDTSLSYLTEFMEAEGLMSVLQCFLDLDNFQKHLLLTSASSSSAQSYTQSNDKVYDSAQAQEDAIVIYDKYFSLQATKQSVKFDDRVRLEAESNICRDGGPFPDCFATPRAMVYSKMAQVYFPRFLKSEQFYKYLSDLMTTIQLSQDVVAPVRRTRAGSESGSEKSAGSTTVVSSNNTLLAMDTSRGQHMKKAINKMGADVNMRIDDMLFNPDNLWHRPNAGSMKLGHINELGQFISGLDPEPDHDKKNTHGFFAKRKEKERTEEEEALQVAQKIIDEIASSTQLLATLDLQ